MKEEKQYKILPNGKCQAVNPCNPCSGEKNVHLCVCDDCWQYTEFAKANPPIDYIPHPEVKENDVVSGSAVWQALNIKLDWIETSDPEWSKSHGFKTRQIVKLHPIAKEEKANKWGPGIYDLHDGETDKFIPTMLTQNEVDVYNKSGKWFQPSKSSITQPIAYTGKGVGESNKLIAEFMGVEIIKRNDEDAIYCFENAAYPEYFRCTKHNTYHEDWNMLMPVVEKIEDGKLMGCQAYINISPFSIDAYCSGNLQRGLNEFNYQVNGKKFAGEDKLTGVYNAVIAFIEWYNTNQQTS